MCYHKRFDAEKAKALIKRFWTILEDDLEYNYFFDFLTILANSSISDIKDFARYGDDPRFERLDLLSLAKEIHPTINSIVSSFDPNFNPPLIQTMTEKGICFSINGIFATNLQATK